MNLEVTEVSKLDAANRQLNQAIRLFFQGGDILAVHTIAGAAFQLFSDLGRADGITSRLRTDEWIRPEYLSDWKAALNRTQNFLKHADRDLGETLKYVEEGTIFLLLEAVELGTQVNKATSKDRTAFMLWFVAAFPELVNPVHLAQLRNLNPTGLDQSDRKLWALYLDRS